MSKILFITLGAITGDDEEPDVKGFGSDKPIETFEGKVIAVYHRHKGNENKWMVSFDSFVFSYDEILRIIHFKEQLFNGTLLLLPLVF